jgi:hypothetical protein
MYLFAGDDWTFTLIFEIVARLRNQVMYEPETALANWATLNQAFADCNVKRDTLDTLPIEFSVADTYYNVAGIEVTLPGPGKYIFAVQRQ